MLNRDSRGESSSRQTPSSNYLVYLFFFSTVLIVVLPYIPYMRNVFTIRSGKKANDVPNKADVSKYSKNSRSSSAPASYPTISSSDLLMPRFYSSEGKCEALEVLVLDLQKVVQIEREKTLHLENEVRVLHISENFLKERIQYLEDKSWESRKDSHVSSMEMLLQGKDLGVDNTIVHELVKLVQVEKDRTSALEKEIRILQKSEAILIERIETLESRFDALCKRSNLCDTKY